MIRRALLAAAIVLSAGLVETASATTALGIWVDADGTAHLYNSTANAISLDGYQIASETDRLDPAGIRSIETLTGYEFRARDNGRVSMPNMGVAISVGIFLMSSLVAIGMAAQARGDTGMGEVILLNLQVDPPSVAFRFEGELIHREELRRLSQSIAPPKGSILVKVNAEGVLIYGRLKTPRTEIVAAVVSYIQAIQRIEHCSLRLHRGDIETPPVIIVAPAAPEHTTPLESMGVTPDIQRMAKKMFGAAHDRIDASPIKNVRRLRFDFRSDENVTNPIVAPALRTLSALGERHGVTVTPRGRIVEWSWTDDESVQLALLSILLQAYNGVQTSEHFFSVNTKNVPPAEGTVSTQIDIMIDPWVKIDAINSLNDAHKVLAALYRAFREKLGEKRPFEYSDIQKARGAADKLRAPNSPSPEALIPVLLPSDVIRLTFMRFIVPMRHYEELEAQWNQIISDLLKDAPDTPFAFIDEIYARPKKYRRYEEVVDKLHELSKLIERVHTYASGDHHFDVAGAHRSSA